MSSLLRRNDLVSASVLVVVIAASSPLLYQIGLALWEISKQNPMLQTLICSFFFGMVSYLMNTIYLQLRHRLISSYTASVTVSSKDENFHSILRYVSEKCKLKTTQFTATTQKKEKKWWEWYKEQGQQQLPEMTYLPSSTSATNQLEFKGKNVWLSRTEPKPITTGNDNELTFLEDLTLTTWGNDPSAIKDLISDALGEAHFSENNETKIYVLGGWWGWTCALKKKPRPVGSVILDENLADELIADGKHFLENAPWYQETGIPYRRGYLFYGPPGCGKTSFAQVFAGAIGIDICLLNLTDESINDTRLARLLREAPNNSLVLLEDVDSVFVERKVADSNKKGAGVSFSGLLNALDGVASQEGRIFILTTNHIDRLDDALIRPGRCDVKVKVRKASNSQITRMFQRFYPESEQFQEFASQIPEYALSMAQIQGHLMLHKNDPKGALNGVPIFLEQVKLGTNDEISTEITIFDHLRRLNLHQYTWLFEYHGYHNTTDLKGLKISEIKEWILDFKLKSADYERLETIFTDELPFDYRLAEYLAVRDTFIRTFYKKKTGLQKKTSNALGSMKLTRQRTMDEVDLDELGTQFCEIVCPERKSLISNFQLRMHLQRYPNPVEAVDKAECLIESRINYDQNWATAWSFLKRANLTSAKWKLEEADIEYVHQLMKTEDDELKTMFGGADFPRVKELLKTHKDDIICRNYELIGFADALWLCRQFFPSDIESDMLIFCDMITNKFGHGKVSVGQVTAFFKKMTITEPEEKKKETEEKKKIETEEEEKKNEMEEKKEESLKDKDEKQTPFNDGSESAFEECIYLIEIFDRVEKELFNPEVPKPEPPAPTEDPEDWMFKFLKENKMDNYYDKFAEAMILELNPKHPLTMNQIKGLGVDKLGDQWKLKDLFDEVISKMEEGENGTKEKKVDIDEERK